MAGKLESQSGHITLADTYQETISTAILPCLLIREGQMSVLTQVFFLRSLSLPSTIWIGSVTSPAWPYGVGWSVKIPKWTNWKLNLKFILLRILKYQQLLVFDIFIRINFMLSQNSIEYHTLSTIEWWFRDGNGGCWMLLLL